MKPILPSRPNHSWLRRRFFGPAIPGISSWPNLPCAVVKWSDQFCYAGPQRETTMNKLDLEHDNIVVTGGAAGIGLAIAQRLAQSGARVSLWDRDEKALKESAAQVGAGTHTARVDVSDEASVKRAFDEALATLGRVDGLVCSAGITGPNLTTWDYPLADWKQVLDINLTGVFLCNKAVI